MNAAARGDASTPAAPGGGPDPNCEALEEAGYVEYNTDKIYYVVHPPAGAKRGQVLLAGFFATDRPRRYVPWVRWARFLARHGFEAVRFDYRGTGESTGRFEDMTFYSWLDDLCAMASWLKERGSGAPVILHGLGLGALLASRAFEQGFGHGLLLWMPPTSGRELLYENLKIRLAHDFALVTKERKTRDQYVADIEAGKAMELEGYLITRPLWKSAAEFTLSEPELTGAGDAGAAARPRHIVELDDLAKHLLGGVGPNPMRTVDGGKPLQLINPDLTNLYSTSLAWVEKVIALPASPAPTTAKPQGAPLPLSPAKRTREPCTRKAMQLSVEGHRLFGAYHEATTNEPVSQAAGDTAGLGILFLSFGQQPRSWVGDLGSAAADRLCGIGYPVFRFDMPGLGDSPGELPVHLEVLWRSIQEGAHRVIAQSLLRELRRLYGLRGLLVAGFCGGAVTAVYAADQKAKDVLGLILLEPEIALTAISSRPRSEQEVLTVASFANRWQLLWLRLRSPRSWMRLITGKSDLAFWRAIPRYLIRRIREKRSGQRLPPETNIQLLEAWQRLDDKKLPRLVLSAGLPARRRYYQSFGLAPGSDHPKTKLTWIEVAGTTHAMLAGGAKESVPAYMEQWIRNNFPKKI